MQNPTRANLSLLQNTNGIQAMMYGNWRSRQKPMGVKKLKRAPWPKNYELARLRGVNISVESDPAFRPRWSRFTPNPIECAESTKPAVVT
jgi:hypothetical protein